MSVVPDEATCFNLNFTNPGGTGPIQSLLLSPKQTCSSDEMAAESEGSKESSPPASRMPMEGTSSLSLLPNGKKTKGRVKIKMEYIGNKLRRYTTFSKRKTGIMKKAYELSTLTGTQVMLLVASETGHVYAFSTNKLKPMIVSDAGKTLIQNCLNTPEDQIPDMSACKTEFTFEPPPGCPTINPRKRKLHETETVGFF
uniref:Serum response factor homolog n=2 Tax=Acrobeloides nanus TaxID=290746 RepID=A0A914EDQ2_9BILA